MLGTLDPAEREVHVIGAGVSGLLAAWALHRKGWTVHVWEKAARAGGLIRTTRSELGMSESAAHSLLATPAVHALGASVGIELVGVREGAKGRFITRKGRARGMPLGPLELLGTVARLLFAKAPAGPAQTVAEFARRHLGEAALKYALQPFLTGVYAGDAEQLDAAAVLGRMVPSPGSTVLGAMRRAKGKKRSSGPMCAPRDGMGSLVDALAGKVGDALGTRFRLGTAAPPIASLRNVVVCTEAPAAAELFSAESPALAAALREVRYAPMTSATLFLREDRFRKVPRGVGVLHSEGQDFGAIGMLFTSSSFEGRAAKGLVSITAMFGGMRQPERALVTDAEIESLSAADLERLYGFHGRPENIVAHRWERAIPQYDAKLVATWAAATEAFAGRPGRVLFGNHAGQVSLRGMIEACEELPPP